MHKGLDEFMHKLDVAMNRLVVALVVAGGLIGSSLIGIFATDGPAAPRRALPLACSASCSPGCSASGSSGASSLRAALGAPSSRRLGSSSTSASGSGRSARAPTGRSRRRPPSGSPSAGSRVLAPDRHRRRVRVAAVDAADRRPRPARCSRPRRATTRARHASTSVRLPCSDRPPGSARRRAARELHEPLTHRTRFSGRAATGRRPPAARDLDRCLAAGHQGTRRLSFAPLTSGPAAARRRPRRPVR